MTLEMCIARADELNISYGSYMASPIHKADVIKYYKMLPDGAKAVKIKNYPHISDMRIDEMRSILPVLRFKARISNIKFEETDISNMCKAALKRQINELYSKLYRKYREIRI